MKVNKLFTGNHCDGISLLYESKDEQIFLEYLSRCLEYYNKPIFVPFKDGDQTKLSDREEATLPNKDC